MMKSPLHVCSKITLLLAFSLLLTSNIFAQTTAFTYQGRLTDGGSPASGSYDLEFKLFNLSSGGVQQGSTQTLSGVTVTNGIFTVQLDFGSSVFTTNTGKFLEIGVRNAGIGGFTTLPQRQPVNATPYAIQSISAAAADSLSAACSGCVTDAKVANGISYSKLSGAPTSLPPSGAAGGDLTGTYPNPTIAANAVTSAKIADSTITDADVSPSAAIAYNKLNLTNSIQNSDLVANSVTTSKVANGTITTSKLADSAVTSLKINDGEIVNADISATAAIAITKIAGLGSLATVTPTGTASSTTFLRGDNTWATPASGGSSVGTILAGRTSSNNSIATPLYLNINGQSAAITSGALPLNAEVVMPIDGTADALRISTVGATTQPTFDITYTLYKNNTSTALTCIISHGSGGTTCNSTANVSFVAGERLSLRAEWLGGGSLPSSTTCSFLSSVHIR